MDNSVIKTYIWHNNKCYFVSTIERESSAMINSPGRYNETMVWEYNWETAERGEILYQEGAAVGSILKHQEIVNIIHADGVNGLV